MIGLEDDKCKVVSIEILIYWTTGAQLSVNARPLMCVNTFI